MRRLTKYVLLSLSFVLSVPSLADMQLNLKQVQGEDKNQFAVIAIKQGKVRFDIDPKRNNYLLFSQADENVSYVSGETKHYVLIDEKGVDTLVAVQKVLMSQMEQQLKDLPKEAKGGGGAPEKAESGGDKKADTDRFLHTSKTRTIAGKTCKVIEQFRGSKKRGDLCVVQKSELGVSDADYASFKAFQLFVQDIITRLPNSDRFNLNAGLFDRGEDYLPVQLQRYVNGKVTESYELDSVSGMVEPALVTLPDGFTRKDLASLFKK